MGSKNEKDENNSKYLPENFNKMEICENDKKFIKSNLIINNNIQVNNNINKSYMIDNKLGLTFIEKSNIDIKPFDDFSESLEDSNNNDKVFVISHLDIKNNDLVIEKEVLNTDGSLIMNKNNSEILNNKNDSILKEMSAKIMKYFAIFLFILLIVAIFLIIYYLFR